MSFVMPGYKPVTVYFKYFARVFICLPVICLPGCNPFNRPGFKQGFTQISQMQIRTLVMHIEFYKLQNGHYPDSLPQLQQADPMVQITDVAPGMQTKFNYYNYEKRGEKYTLFSSGDDGVAGTKDDFYPQIEIPDSSKIGLVKHN